MLVHLAPAPVVARVATTTALVRPDVFGYLARDLAVADYLARAGVPVVRPSDQVPPGPHRLGGWVVSFWEYVVVRPGQVSPPARVAALLADLHEVLRGYAGDLPSVPPLEMAALTAYLRRRGGYDPSALDELDLAAARVVTSLDGESAPVQPLHGDAHSGNLLATDRGPLWTDFEDTWRGCVGWDLACLAESRRPEGRAAARLYPVPPEVDWRPYRAARRLQLVAWWLLLGARVPRYRPEALRRLASWRADPLVTRPSDG